jgi:acid phosphatase
MILPIATSTRAPRRRLAALLAAASFAAGCSWFAGDPPQPPPAFSGHAPDVALDPARATTPRFFAFGDSGTGGKGQRRVAAGLAARARKTPPDFLLLLGDNFYPSGVESIDDPQWVTAFEEPYGDPALARPFYVVLGNHDHHGDVQAQIDYGAAHPRWILPAPWYEFRVALPGGATADFYALDTTQLLDETPVAEQQLQWLAGALGRSRGRWQVVFGHHPFRSSHKSDDAYRSRLEPILRGFGVDLALFGHDHYSQWLAPVDGVHCAIAGGGGGRDNDVDAEKSLLALWSESGGGFADVMLDAERIVVEFADADGATRQRFEIPGAAP